MIDRFTERIEACSITAESADKRRHRTIKASLKCHLQQNKSWVDALPFVLHGLHSALKEDISYSSAELLYVEFSVSWQYLYRDGDPIYDKSKIVDRELGFKTENYNTLADEMMNLDQRVLRLGSRKQEWHSSGKSFQSMEQLGCSAAYLSRRMHPEIFNYTLDFRTQGAHFETL
ncbi:hypothetical protein CEXT_683471 [Caerostris extrusa]|uniref:Uncharacterized protein n=1 Tax=Caerostris extrusa TaxID=172846 RepID=A0AAV4WH62_CAEEX|nr:hypothetical protein CEXT_683471 [Caerostris extrusa]